MSATPLDRVRIVLVSPSHAGNVGSTARAMKVMGLSRLALVAPRHADVLSRDEARSLASGAVDVLDAATVHATLDDALVGTVHAVALSARDREYAPPVLALGDACRDALAREGDVAFVFGSERYGLSNDDVLRCAARCRIETAEDYASLNLAQAVQLVAYGCRMASLAGATTTPAPTPQRMATHEEQQDLLDHLEQGLVAIGYLDPDAPKKLMPRVRRLFARAGLEHEEVQWLRGMAKAMTKAAAKDRG